MGLTSHPRQATSPEGRLWRWGTRWAGAPVRPVSVPWCRGGGPAGLVMGVPSEGEGPRGIFVLFLGFEGVWESGRHLPHLMVTPPLPEAWAPCPVCCKPGGLRDWGRGITTGRASPPPGQAPCAGLRDKGFSRVTWT